MATELSDPLLSQDNVERIELEEEEKEEGRILPPNKHHKGEDDSTSCCQRALTKSVAFLNMWVNTWQFLLLPLFLFPAAFSTSTAWDSFGLIWTAVTGLNLLSLWLAVIIFPLGVDYPDVPWMSLFPTLLIFAVVFGLYLVNGDISWTWDIDGSFSSVWLGSYIWIVGVVAMKKLPTLKQKLFGDGTLRLLWTWMAIISLFVIDNPAESVIATLLSCILVTPCHHLSKPSQVVYLLSIAYPCLPVHAMKAMEEKEQERLNTIEGKSDAKLERQYAKLGGRTSPAKKLSQAKGQLLFPVIMGILVVWSLVFLLGYGEFLERKLEGPVKLVSRLKVTHGKASQPHD